MSVLGDYLTGIAGAIRTKKGTSADINAQDFEDEILSIPTGGGGGNIDGIIDASYVGVLETDAVVFRQYAVYLCTGIISVKAPLATRLYDHSLNGCSGIVKADFGALTRLDTSSFRNCTAFETIIIRTPSVATLSGGTGVFYGTPIAAGTGYIYVPSSLVASYQSATNWTSFAGQIRAIEAYPEVTA